MKMRCLTHLLTWSAVALVGAAARGSEDRGAGCVYLVGIGPGDLDLMTVRATQVIRNADRVFCFSYQAKAVRGLAKPDAVREVGDLLAKRFYGARGQQAKAGSPSAVESAPKFQEFAAGVRQLVANGKKVAIVDGGDPLIFGAWAWVTEEFEDLPLDVVPGVSAFNAANAALKRDVLWGGRRCVVLSGGSVLGIPPEVARMDVPCVFFTHRVPLSELLPRLREHYPADTPLAVVCNAGCQDQQEVIRATLGTIQERLGQRVLPHLNLVYVGDVLTLQHKK